MSKEERENRCFCCGCCDQVDGFCDLMHDYAFNIEKCTASDEEKSDNSWWNM